MPPEDTGKGNRSFKDMLAEFERKKDEFFVEITHEQEMVKEAIEELNRERAAYVNFSKTQEENIQGNLSVIEEKEDKLREWEERIQGQGRVLEEKMNQLAQEQNQYITMAIEKERAISAHLEKIGEREEQLQKLEDAMRSKVDDLDRMLKAKEG